MKLHIIDNGDDNNGPSGPNDHAGGRIKPKKKFSSVQIGGAVIAAIILAALLFG